MEAFILALLKGFAVPAFYAVIRWLWPAKATAQFPADELAEINGRYRRHEYVSVALFLLLFWPVAGVICTYSLILLQRWHDSQMPPSLLLIRLQPSWLNWLLPGEFLGLIFGGWALIFCTRWYYGENEYRRITAAANHNNRFDGTKVFGGLGAFVVGLATTWAILDLDWYTRFEEDKIVINSLSEFST